MPSLNEFSLVILDKGKKKKKERRTKHISTDNTGCCNVAMIANVLTVVLHETKINLYESNIILNISSVYCYAWFDLNLIIKKSY